MSESNLTALSAKIKETPSLKEQLKNATDFDQVVTIFKSAGVEITKAELLKSQATRILALSDAELESVHISRSYTTSTFAGCVTYVLQCCG